MLENISWLGHAAFKISDAPLVYIDPWKLSGRDRADLILITHSHYDHCSSEDVNKLRKETTVVVAPADCSGKLECDVRAISPGTKLAVGDVQVTAVPAYNVDKQFHPKSSKWVGFVVEIGGKRIYHAGDTDFVHEMKELKDLAIDVALLPVGGTYTMDAAQAADAANAIQPKVAVPMHFGTIVGGVSDAERFKQLCKVPVEILKPLP